MTNDESQKLMDYLGEKFAQVDQRFDAVDARFAQVDQRFDAVDARFAQVDRKFDAIDHHFVEVRADVAGLRRGLAMVENRLTETRQDLDAFRDETRQEFATVKSVIRLSFADLERRLRRRRPPRRKR